MMEAEFTTNLLCPNMKLFSLTSTPRCLSVLCRSIVCSMQVLAATNSDEHVAVSTMACFLECQLMGVPLTKCRHAVMDLPVNTSWRRLASTQWVS